MIRTLELLREKLELQLKHAVPHHDLRESLRIHQVADLWNLLKKPRIAKWQSTA